MFREATIALLATAALGILAPDVVSARGGGGGFGGGMHGGFGGGAFHGGGGFGRSGSHAAQFNGGRAAANGGRGFRAGFREGFRAGLTARTSNLAIRTTVVNGQRTKVQCFTSDCRLRHSWTE
jgi:hypothetical protein